jgi:hypothetical protein
MLRLVIMKKNYLYFLILCILLLQCRNKEINAIDESPINSDIVISIAEGPENSYFHNEFKSIYLSAQTKMGYPCGGRIIEAEQTSDEAQFSIQYKRIITPGNICNWAGGSASSNIKLGRLANGDYELELNTPDWKNKGILKVDSTSITLIFDELKSIEIPEPKIQRALK